MVGGGGSAQVARSIVGSLRLANITGMMRQDRDRVHAMTRLECMLYRVHAMTRLECMLDRVHAMTRLECMLYRVHAMTRLECML